MSLLLLSQPPKLCFRRPVLVRSFPHGLPKGFSPSSMPETPFRVYIGKDPCRPSLSFVRNQVTKRSFTEEWQEKREKLLEFTKEVGTLGSSNGWLTTVNDGVLRFRDVDLDLDAASVSLPPFVTLAHCQTQVVTNVVMSSSSPEDEDCVVAVKFLGPQLSFCRPGQSNSEWTNMRFENPCFFTSHVMYSKKDDMIRILGSGGHLIGSWDLCKHSKNHIQFQSLRFQNLPKLNKAKRDHLDSCYTSEQLVESRTSGETFLVKLYRKTGEIIDSVGTMRTQYLMVFKLDEQGNAVYTQDTGDETIFLTKCEPFCVPDSTFPPRCVHIVDVDERRVFRATDSQWNFPRKTHVKHYSSQWFWDRV
ncbi:unnamed protein product [Microthlaspi erraticum]|uniref:KIB1-4 beta-propeller domain-containing protein n=1 Tax=Microthlaspi erraticum TaxID=1685480 RepID=A0A6D2J4A0_9BRAS|nr:unnamed protein product [Microthlaspi erraticum]